VRGDDNNFAFFLLLLRIKKNNSNRILKIKSGINTNPTTAPAGNPCEEFCSWTLLPLTIVGLEKFGLFVAVAFIVEMKVTPSGPTIEVIISRVADGGGV